MLEIMAGAGFEDGGLKLLERIQKIKNENFGELYESSANFIPGLRAGVEREFPNEPKAWEMVPAYHALTGSTMKESEEREISTEAKGYIEAEISDFISSFEK